MKIYLTRAIAVFVAAACVAACHDTHRDNSMTMPSPPTPSADPTVSVPDSAGASVDGFISYLKSLVAAAADMLEPVDVSKVKPKTDETSEPAPVN